MGRGVRAGNGSGRVVPAPPEDLGAEGREVWGAAWRLPRIEAPDAAMVLQLCRLQDEAARLRGALAADGMVLRAPIQSAKGEVVGESLQIHPAVAMLRRIGREAAEVAGELGLSPAGRRRLGMDVPDEPHEPDWLDTLKDERRERLAKAERERSWIAEKDRREREEGLR
jgi:P27 family predicted phage terminase small subunit